MIRPDLGKYPITQYFNDARYRSSYYRFGMNGHNGWDIGTPSGTPIVAPHNGKVLEVGFDSSGYGNYVKIDNGVEGSVLAHLSSIGVSVGQHVSEGQQIGQSGNTGNSTGPHLHWGYYRNPRDRSNGFAGFIDQSPYLTNKQEVNMPTLTGKGDINALYLTFLGRPMYDFGADKYIDPGASTWVGKPFNDAFYGIKDSAEGQAYARREAQMTTELADQTANHRIWRERAEKAEALVADLAKKLEANDLLTKSLQKRIEDLENNDNIVITKTGWGKLFDEISKYFKRS